MNNNISNEEEITKHKKIIYWLWLKLALNDSSVKTFKLYKEFGDIEKLYKSGPESFKDFKFLTEENISSLCDKNTSIAHETYCLCDANNIDIITIEDDLYPSQLKNLDIPPCVIFFYGNYKEAISKPMVTIVGTRKCTAYGEQSSSRMGGALAMSGCTIVTGCAKGVDSCAASGSLKASGSVISILPSGHLSNNLHSLTIFRGITFHGGFLSEHLPKSPTTKFAYHERNRLLAALSEAVVVTQAPEKSGALITAHYALDLGIDVYALPANIDITVSKGSNELFRDGAIPLFSHTDILIPLKSKYGNAIQDRVTENDLIEFDKIDKSEDSVNTESGYKKTVSKALSKDQATVFNALTTEDRMIDTIVDITQMNLYEVLSILTELETMNLIMKLPGNKYKILY